MSRVWKCSLILALTLSLTSGLRSQTFFRSRLSINSLIGNSKHNIIRCYAQRKDDFDEAFDEILETRDEDQYLPRRSERSSSSQPSKKRPYLANTSLSGINKWEVVNRALVAGVFVAGIGAGITIDSAINTNPRDLASRDAIDRNAPNPKLCSTFGSSAMVLDTRVFVTFNPFNVNNTSLFLTLRLILHSLGVRHTSRHEARMCSSTCECCLPATERATTADR